MKSKIKNKRKNMNGDNEHKSFVLTKTKIKISVTNLLLTIIMFGAGAMVAGAFGFSIITSIQEISQPSIIIDTGHLYQEILSRAVPEEMLVPQPGDSSTEEIDWYDKFFNETDGWAVKYKGLCDNGECKDWGYVFGVYKEARKDIPWSLDYFDNPANGGNGNGEIDLGDEKAMGILGHFGSIVQDLLDERETVLCQDDGDCEGSDGNIGGCFGTAEGECSDVQPKQCVGDKLVNNCVKCGCGSNKECMSEKNICKPTGSTPNNNPVLKVFYPVNITFYVVGDLCDSGDCCMVGGPFDGLSFKNNSNFKVVKVDDPNLDHYEQKMFFETGWTEQELKTLKTEMEKVKTAVSNDTNGGVNLQVSYIGLSGTIKMQKAGPDKCNFTPGPGVMGELILPHLDLSEDFVAYIYDNVDNLTGRDLLFGYGGLAFGPDAGVRGSGYFITNNLLMGFSFHEIAHLFDLTTKSPAGPSDVPDIYAKFYYNQEDNSYNYSRNYPKCGQADPNPLKWFPSADDCCFDPDWQISCGCSQDPDPTKRHCDDVNAFTSHIFSAHYNTGNALIGNHCRDGKQDFGETGVDTGGVCSADYCPYYLNFRKKRITYAQADLSSAPMIVFNFNVDTYTDSTTHTLRFDVDSSFGANGLPAKLYDVKSGKQVSNTTIKNNQIIFSFNKDWQQSQDVFYAEVDFTSIQLQQKNEYFQVSLINYTGNASCTQNIRGLPLVGDKFTYDYCPYYLNFNKVKDDNKGLSKKEMEVLRFNIGAYTDAKTNTFMPDTLDSDFDTNGLPAKLYNNGKLISSAVIKDNEIIFPFDKSWQQDKTEEFYITVDFTNVVIKNGDRFMIIIYNKYDYNSNASCEPVLNGLPINNYYTFNQ